MMPKYEYACNNCDNVNVEVFRKMTESEPQEGYMCPSCGYRLIRVYTANPVKFNAPGFYSTGG